MTQNIIIIGQGINAACTALELSRRSSDFAITMIADHRATNGAIASGASWGWVNAHTDHNEAYYRFRNSSRALWHGLIRDYPQISARIQSSIVFDLPPEDIENTAVEHAAWEYPVTAVSRTGIETILPQFRTPPDAALFTKGEVAVETEIVASELAALSGATQITAHVHGLIQEGGKLCGVMTDAGPQTADHIILAAGHGTPALLGTIGIAYDLDQSFGLLVRTKPMMQWLDTMIMGPDYHVRQCIDGSLLIGGTFDANNDTSRNVSDTALNLCRRVEANFDMPLGRQEHLEIERFSIGKRVLPKGGLPHIGPVGHHANLFAMAMHGGVTNAPLAATVCADHIMGLQRRPETLPFTFPPLEKEPSHV